MRLYYSYRLLSGTAMVIMSIYLFTALNQSLPEVYHWRLSAFCHLCLNNTSYSKSVAKVNRKCPLKNTMVQLSIPCTDPECHNILCHRQTDGSIKPIANHTACSSWVRFAKNWSIKTADRTSSNNSSSMLSYLPVSADIVASPAAVWPVISDS